MLSNIVFTDDVASSDYCMNQKALIFNLFTWLGSVKGHELMENFASAQWLQSTSDSFFASLCTQRPSGLVPTFSKQESFMLPRFINGTAYNNGQ